MCPDCPFLAVLPILILLPLWNWSNRSHIKNTSYSLSFEKSLLIMMFGHTRTLLARLLARRCFNHLGVTTLLQMLSNPNHRQRKCKYATINVNSARTIVIVSTAIDSAGDWETMFAREQLLIRRYGCIEESTDMFGNVGR